jgi:hypothetical protein
LRGYFRLLALVEMMCSKYAKRAPRELRAKSLIELNRPGIKIWRISEVAARPEQIASESHGLIFRDRNGRRRNIGTSKRKLATGSSGPP